MSGHAQTGTHTQPASGGGGGGAVSSAGGSYRVAWTAAGPVLIPVTIVDDVVTEGTPIAPDAEGNTGYATFGEDSVVLTAGLQYSITNSYWASWIIPNMGAVPFAFCANVKHMAPANWFPMAVGLAVHRAAVTGDFTDGAGGGLNLIHSVSMCKQDVLSGGSGEGGINEGNACVGCGGSQAKIGGVTVWGIDDSGGVRNRNYNSGDWVTNGGPVVPGEYVIITQYLNGTGTLAAGEIKQSCTLTPKVSLG